MKARRWVVTFSGEARGRVREVTRAFNLGPGFEHGGGFTAAFIARKALGLGLEVLAAQVREHNARVDAELCATGAPGGAA